MIWSIAWKNVWRNGKRSLVVIVAVTLGIISGVLLVGIMEGWVKQRLNDAIYNEVSHIQIHNNEYLKNEDINLTVLGLKELSQSIDSLSGVLGWTTRTKIFAIANTPWANTGIKIYGINPDKEKHVTTIYSKIISPGGTYLDAHRPGDILISDKTAEILKLKQFVISDSTIEKLAMEKVPGKILSTLHTLKGTRYKSQKDFHEALAEVFSLKELNSYGLMITDLSLDYRLRNKVQVAFSDRLGTPIQGIFRVCGIYRTTNSGFDQVSAFVNSGELAKLYGGDALLTHEVAILLKNLEDVDLVKERLVRISGDNSVSTWKELAPDAALMNDFMIIYYFIFIGIIMLALAFGIINTMLMAILERTRELGMLMAIGMNHRRIFTMIMLETIFLTLVGAVAGMLCGWAIASILGNTGIHFSAWGEGFEAIGFAAKVYPVVTPKLFVFITILVMATAVVSSVWPARKALKLNPVEALRIE
jgi:ABC-type lipoprotein release transport system permease subunit